MNVEWNSVLRSLTDHEERGFNSEGMVFTATPLLSWSLSGYHWKVKPRTTIRIGFCNTVGTTESYHSKTMLQ